MSSSDRQSKLLVTEDWKRIYQSFRNAEFQSYDFDNLRRAMINYLRQNYPEDFNDYIESSEYLALIDMIAFLGQNLSFRIDLNARENFLETAERRESVLRLARMLSYNPRRNQAANGLFKFSTIKTSESIFDSTGINLQNTVIKWNDQTNSNYFEQFTKILNAALPLANQIGNPLKNDTISNVSTQKYRLNAVNTSSAIFPFTKIIEGNNVPFEIVSTDIKNNSLSEEPPLPGTSPAFLFRDDGQGPGSSNTGFFMHVRQGVLQTGTFNVTNPVPNQVVGIDVANINDTDVWLYSVDTNGFETTNWTKLDAVEGNSVIYNSLFNQVRDIFQVQTRIGDRINVAFSDGIFGNLPSGSFKIYYRTSINKPLSISPGSIGTVLIDIPYQSKSGTEETLTIGLRLQYTINNSSQAESNAEIKLNAPSTFYTQNRLVTGEDYNIGPLSVSQDIIKTRSVNRISSGISRYFDLKDPSGKYSTTKLYANDGIVYKELYQTKQDFTFTSQSDIEGVIVNNIQSIVRSNPLRNFYMSEYLDLLVRDLNAAWVSKTVATNRNVGILQNLDSVPFRVGSFASNSLKSLTVGSMLKFVAPTGKHFMADNSHAIMDGDANHHNAVTYKWTRVVNITEDGTEVNSLTGQGGIVLSDVIPEGALLEKIIPVYSTNFSNDLKLQIIDQAFAYKDFALRYDRFDREWKIITASNINTVNDFSLGKTGDSTNTQSDNSWLLLFETDGQKYTITARGRRYVFESNDQLRFFFDSTNKIYDSKSGTIVSDVIKVLSINTKPDDLNPFTVDWPWQITKEFKNDAGYINSKKVEISFYDSDSDGVVDDPDLFEHIVAPDANTNTKYIYQKKSTVNKTETFNYVDAAAEPIYTRTSQGAIGALSQYNNGDVFYLIDRDVFLKYNQANNALEFTSDYLA